MVRLNGGRRSFDPFRRRRNQAIRLVQGHALLRERATPHARLNALRDTVGARRNAVYSHRLGSPHPLAARGTAVHHCTPSERDPGVRSVSEAAPTGELSPEALWGRFARLALACIHREYPNHLGHLLTSDTDALPPRRLTPAFFGCFDCHSAVHAHWLLVRLCRTAPEADYAGAARSALARSLTPANAAAELRYVATRPGFERPYGMAAAACGRAA